MNPWRSDFPFFQKHSLLYLDSAATTHKPQCVIDRLTRFYSEEYATVHRAVYAQALGASEEYQSVRSTVQRFLNAAHPEEIVFTRGTTSALNLVAFSYGRAFLKPGDRILLSESEHHANLVPWQMLSKERGCSLSFIPVDEKGVLILEEAERLMQEGVRLVSIAHVSNVLGTVHPIQELARLARQVGAAICVDGAQSAGHQPIDVQQLDIDFFAFSGHKVYGPTGVGVLYGRKALLEQMAPLEGGGDMVDRVTLEQTTYAPVPLRFEAGTPMTAAVLGLGAALSYLSHIGLDRVHAWENQLLVRATELLSTLPGIRLIGRAEKKGPIVSFIKEGIHPLDLATLLDCRGVAVRSGNQCSQPTLARFGLSELCRASFGLYNTLEEVERFASILTSL